MHPSFFLMPYRTSCTICQKKAITFGFRNTIAALKILEEQRIMFATEKTVLHCIIYSPRLLCV